MDYRMKRLLITQKSNQFIIVPEKEKQLIHLLSLNT